LENNTKGSYLMRLSATGGALAGLTLEGVNNGINTIKSLGVASNLRLESENTITTTSVGLTTMNTVGLDINAGAGNVTCDTTGQITLTSTSDMTLNGGIFDINSTAELTLQSTGETEINCAAFDVNATGAITIDTPSTTVLTSEGITLECPLTSLFGIKLQTNEVLNDIELTTIGATSDIHLLSTAATITLTAGTEADITCATLDLNASTAATLDAPTITTTSTGTTQINSAALDINATGAITADSTSTIGITSVGQLTLGSGAAETEINCAALDINATGAITMDTDDPITITSSANGITLSSFGEQDITCGSLDINSAGTATIDSTSNMSLTSGGTLILGSGANETEINCGVLDINASDAASLDATAISITASTGNMTWTTSATGDFNITSGRNVNFVTNSTGGIMNCTSNKDQDVFKVNNTSFDSKYLIGSATTGFRTQVNNNSYANLLGLGNTQVNITTNNASITFTAGGGNAVNIAVDSTFNMTPTASIITRVVSGVPAGFLACVGGNVSRTTYARLFGVISTTYGAGDGSTTFGLPDFEGCFLRGAGTQTIGGVAYAAAAVGTAQQDSVLEAYNEGFWNVDAGGGGSSRSVRSRLQLTGDPEDTGGNSTTKFTRQNATENRPVNHAVYYFIRY
jgi:phage gp45-like